MLAFVASMALPTHVSAQFDLGKAFKSLIGGDDEPTPYELIAQNAPAASDVVYPPLRQARNFFPPPHTSALSRGKAD